MLRITELGNKSIVERTTDAKSDKEALHHVINNVLVQVRDKEKDVLVLYENEKVQYNKSTSTEEEEVPKRILVPSGLLFWLCDELDHLGYDYQVELLPKLPRIDVSNKLLSGGPVPITLRDYQVLSLKKGLTHRRGIFNIGTGGGKCLAPDTLVLLHNGDRKRAGDVVVGDKLMGPDSLPREVLSTTVGEGPMYRIKPTKGNAWLCNDAHILCLQDTVTGEITEISVADYLKTTKKFKHRKKQYITGVSFGNDNVDKPINVWEPYFVGLWLGDGAKNRRDNGALTGIKITNVDSEIIEELKNFAQRNNCYLHESRTKGKAPDWLVSNGRKRTNTALELLRAVFPKTCKLPKNYLCSSTQARLELLAGLLDSDGYLHHGFFEIVQKNQVIANDIEYLARSLGFMTTRKYKEVDGRLYTRINILGDVSRIPTRVLRKKAKPRKQKKDVKRSGFAVEALGVGPYAGFTLSGDGRFLLGDFVVTHNTEIIIGLAKILGSSLTIVPGKGVLKQCYRRFKDRGIDDVGRLGAGYNNLSCNHTIATASVINSRLNKGCPKIKDLLDRVTLLMFDEVHHLGTAPSWQNVANNCGAERRYGFSGSPWASGKPAIDLTNYKESRFADFRVASQVGDTLVYIPSKMLREMGVIVDPNIYVVAINKPKGLTRNPFPRWRWVYNRGIIENDHRNYLIAEAANRLHKREHRTVILVVSIPHGKDILKRLYAYGLNAAFTKGSDEVLVYTGKKIKKHRDAGEKFRDAFLAGEIDVLIGSVVIDEAVDLPEMSALILAGGMKSPIRAVQRIGRAIRTAEGKSEAVVIDFRDRQHYFLNNHTNVRLGIYDAHEYDYEEVEWDELWENLDDNN